MHSSNFSTAAHGDSSFDHSHGISGTASGTIKDEGACFSVLLREGLIAIIALFVACALPTMAMGNDKSDRLVIVVIGFVIVFAGVIMATTLGGRLFLALSYSVFFEHNYFTPLNIGFMPIAPSTFLAILIIFMDFRRHRPDMLLTASGQGERYIYDLLLYLGMLLIGQFVAAVVCLNGIEAGIFGIFDYTVPTLIFAYGGVRLVRHSEAGIFLDLLPYLAVANAIIVWVYTLTGERMLYYRMDELIRMIFDRFGGLLYNANNTAFFCSLAILIALSRLRLYSTSLKVATIVNSLFMAGTVIMLRSRAPLLLVALGLFLPFRKGTRIWVIPFVIMGFFSFYSFGEFLTASQSIHGQHLVERMESLGDAMETRWLIAKDTIEAITQWPLGTGQVGGILSNQSFSIMRHEPHNEYLGFVLRNGIQSLIPLVIIFATLGLVWQRSIYARFPHRPAPVLYVVVFAYLFTSLFEPVYYNSHELGKMMGAILGMFAASVVYADARLCGQDNNTPT